MSSRPPLTCLSDFEVLPAPTCTVSALYTTSLSRASGRTCLHADSHTFHFFTRDGTRSRPLARRTRIRHRCCCRYFRRHLGEVLTRWEQRLLLAGSHCLSKAQHPVDHLTAVDCPKHSHHLGLIPILRNDVHVMQGRTDETSNTVQTLNFMLDTINKDISTATNSIKQFNGDLATAAQSVNSTRLELAQIQTQLKQTSEHLQHPHSTV